MGSINSICSCTNPDELMEYNSNTNKRNIKKEAYGMNSKNPGTSQALNQCVEETESNIVIKEKKNENIIKETVYQHSENEHNHAYRKLNIWMVQFILDLLQKVA